jgi:hypothetical protein
VVPRNILLDLQRLGIIRVWVFLSLESLLRASSALVLFECGPSCPSNRSFGLAALWYYSSAGVLVPRIAPSGQQCLGIIRVRAFLSLKSLLGARSALVLFECGRSCPSNRSFGLEAHRSYSSSAGYFVPRSALFIFFECGLSCPSKRTTHILRVRAILFLEVHCSYSSSVGYFVSRSVLLLLFECGLSCPLNRSFGSSAPALLFECGLSCPSKRTAHILRVRAILSLEGHCSYTLSAGYLVPRSVLLILFECGRSVPRITSSGL